MTDYKACSDCGQTFPTTPDNFYFYPNGTPFKRCRKCQNAYLKANRDQHREQYRADQKAWRDANRDKIAGENYRSYHNHRDYHIE